MIFKDLKFGFRIGVIWLTAEAVYGLGCAIFECILKRPKAKLEEKMNEEEHDSTDPGDDIDE